MIDASARDLDPEAVGKLAHRVEMAIAEPALLTPAADELPERAAVIEEGACVPRHWAEGFAALSSMASPVGFSPERWRNIINSAGRFIDEWAPAAIASGWTELDVFGCDAERPDPRLDCMGLVLLLDRARIVALDSGGADLVVEPGETRQRYRRRSLPPGTVSLWDLR